MATQAWCAAVGLACGLTVAASAALQPSPFSVDVADTAARALPQLRSLLVSRRGQVMFERYDGGARVDRPVNVKSASKSVISALVSIAIDRGVVKGVRQPIVTYFPELRVASNRGKQAITVEDLLTMRSGLEGTSGRQ